MKFVQEEFSNTYEEKKSKFIAYIVPYNEFNNLMKQLRNKHPKARHFVYAYRYLNQYEQVVENSSDDGEPKGTSGKPALSVLSGADIINSAVIIIRYFGGIKLGTGGLVRAYSNSVNEVINISKLYEYKKMTKKKLYSKYNELSKLEYFLKKNNISIINKNFTDDVILEIDVTNEQWELLLENMKSHVKN